jgi:hypothetical protein
MFLLLIVMHLDFFTIKLPFSLSFFSLGVHVVLLVFSSFLLPLLLPPFLLLHLLVVVQMGVAVVVLAFGTAAVLVAVGAA